MASFGCHEVVNRHLLFWPGVRRVSGKIQSLTLWKGVPAWFFCDVPV